MAHTPPGETRAKILAFMRERLASGRSPSLREVQSAFGLKAVESVRAHIEALIADGQLLKIPGQARGYRLPPNMTEADPARLVPLLGHVQAGRLQAAIEDPQGYLLVHTRTPQEKLFALRVRGDSMRDAGILDGDTVIVRQQPKAEDGDIVVALVGDEATVKRLRFVNRRPQLHPENPAYDPIIPDPDEPLELLGRVIEVRRKL